MELAFETKSLREICTSEETAKAELGISVAAHLKRRLADLKAASSIDELPLAKPRKNSLTCALELSEGYRIVAAANHPENPTHASGKINWTAVSRLKLLRIEKTK